MGILYVGVDWGSENHAVCVMHEDGRIAAERMVRNDGQFITTLMRLLGGDLPGAHVAIESRELPIVDMLLSGGASVFTVNPKQAERFRDRLSAGGAKDDRRDARVLAGALRTDREAFRCVETESTEQARLRLCGRAVFDAEERFRLVANQLRAVLARYFPAVLALSSGADERWLWRLLAQAPTPGMAAELAVETLETLLRSCGVRRFDAARLQDVLRAPHLRVGEGVERACAEEAQRLVALLEILYVQRSHATKLRDEALERLAEQQRASASVSDVDLVLTMPGSGKMVVATLFGEAEGPLRDRNLGALRGMSGVAPVTKRSGKSTHVSMRRARHAPLANALFHAARVAAMNDPRFKALFTAIRGRGKSYGRALRGVADRYLDVLFALLRTGRPYDASRWEASAVAA